MDVRAPLRPDLSAHTLRRGERRHGIEIGRRKRRRSERGDEKVGVASLQLFGALLVLARHDLDLVFEFLVGQGPSGVGLEVARDEVTFVELELFHARTASFVGFGVSRVGLLARAAR